MIYYYLIGSISYLLKLKKDGHEEEEEDGHDEGYSDQSADEPHLRFAFVSEFWLKGQPVICAGSAAGSRRISGAGKESGGVDWTG